MKPPIDDPPETDIEIMRDARRHQAKQAASDDYGETETVIDDNGRAVVKPRFTPPTLQELLLLSKIEKAETEAKAAKSTPVRAGAVKQFLINARKPAPKKEEPPATKSWGKWFAARFARPSKPVFK